MPVNYFDTGTGVVGFSQKNYRTDLHAHFFIEVAISVSGRLTVITRDHKYVDIQAAVIQPNIVHTFACLDGECQIYFIDPTGSMGERLLRRYPAGSKGLVVTDMDVAAQFNVANSVRALANLTCDSFTDESSRDDRIQRCLAWIEAHYTEEGMGVSTLSEKSFLSESRLAHLFKEQIGISIHQYILWKKTGMAVKKYMDGYSLTECAHSSGFTDSSHFIKVFKKMFGVTPSFALKK